MKDYVEYDGPAYKSGKCNALAQFDAIQSLHFKSERAPKQHSRAKHFINGIQFHLFFLVIILNP